jgi:hypothetical protein
MTTQTCAAFSILAIAIFAIHSTASVGMTSQAATVIDSNFCTLPSHVNLCYAGAQTLGYTLPNGSTVIVAQISAASRIGSVVLVISPLTYSGGKYHNTQTTTVKSTSGTLMNGVAVTMYENAGKSGGYFHGVTGPTKYPAGETVEHDTYPGPGSYTEWSSASWKGQTVLSLKITVIVP